MDRVMKRKELLYVSILLLFPLLLPAETSDLVLTAQPPKVGALFPASQRPALSSDGRFIVFETVEALEPEDKNKLSDIYLYDRESEGVKRIPGIDPMRLSAGASISPDGRVITFHSTLKENLKKKTTRISDVVIYDVPTGTAKMVPSGPTSEKEGESLFPRFAFNDDQILFTSNNPHLIPEKPAHVRQVYMYDRDSEQTKRLTQTANGAAANRACGDARLSGNGNFLVFRSAATNLMAGVPLESLSNDLFYLNLETQFVFRINEVMENFVGAFDIDEKAQKVVFESRERNLQNPFALLETSDLFLFDASSRTVARLTSGIFSGRAHSPSLSADGRYLAFVFKAGSNGHSDPGGLVVYDTREHQWKRVVSAPCASPMISADGSTIVYELIQEKKISKRKKAKVRTVAVSQNPFVGN